MRKSVKCRTCQRRITYPADLADDLVGIDGVNPLCDRCYFRDYGSTERLSRERLLAARHSNHIAHARQKQRRDG